jgi:hypothetical protein
MAIRNTDLKDCRRGDGMIDSRASLSENVGACGALEADTIVSTVTERPLLACSATTQRDRGLACQVPLFAIGIGQHDRPLYPKRAVWANGDFYRIRHELGSLRGWVPASPA